MHVPGSSKAMTRTQALDAFNIPDWHPDEHPAMPGIVEHGRQPAVRGCGYCHLPNGLGRPENASLASLSASYIVQQVADFKSGARTSSETKMTPPAAMIVIAAAATDAEVKAAAGYFSNLKLKPWIRVIENHDRAENLASQEACSFKWKAAARNRLARASLRRRKIWNARNCATRLRDSSPTCRSEASRRARRWSLPAAGEQDDLNAPSAMVRNLKGLRPAASPRGAARQATFSGSSTTSSTGFGTANGAC